MSRDDRDDEYDDSEPESQQDSRNRYDPDAYRDYEIERLERRNQNLEQRVAEQEWREFGQRKKELERSYEEINNSVFKTEEYLARAIAEGNGEDAAKALRFRDEAFEKKHKITQDYQQLQQYEQQAQIAQQQKTSKQDRKVNRLARNWISKHDWYDVNGGNEDSRTVLEIDQGLANEGYVPRTELYWKELDKRVRRSLPHRFESTHERAAPARKEQVYISKERKEALIAAGVWDDPVLRTRYVKRYQEWDKENATA